MHHENTIKQKQAIAGKICSLPPPPRSLCVTQSLRSADITYFSHPTRSNPKVLWCVCSSRHTFSRMVYLLTIIIYVQLLKNPCSFSMIYIYNIVCILIRPFHKINFTIVFHKRFFFLLPCH